MKCEESACPAHDLIIIYYGVRWCLRCVGITVAAVVVVVAPRLRLQFHNSCIIIKINSTLYYGRYHCLSFVRMTNVHGLRSQFFVKPVENSLILLKDLMENMSSTVR